MARTLALPRPADRAKGARGMGTGGSAKRWHAATSFVAAVGPPAVSLLSPGALSSARSAALVSNAVSAVRFMQRQNSNAVPYDGLPTSCVPGSKPLIQSMHFAQSVLGWYCGLLLVSASFAVHACGAAGCRDLDGPLAMEGNVYTGRYSEELVATAKRLASAGKGILAADESTGTVGKRVRVVQASRRRSTSYLRVSSRHPRHLLTGPTLTSTPRPVHAVGRHQRRERGAEQTRSARAAVPRGRHRELHQVLASARLHAHAPCLQLARPCRRRHKQHDSEARHLSPRCLMLSSMRVPGDTRGKCACC